MKTFIKDHDFSFRYLLTDVDDTITSSGKLLPEALQALWDLQNAGIRTILVTGGSAGGSDACFKQWPVFGVIAESGAVCWYRDESGRRIELVNPKVDLTAYPEKAEKLKKRVLSEVPGSKLAPVHYGRAYDVSFDYQEEKPFLGDAEIEKILQICREEGAETGVSTIHVNCWFGDFDKLGMVTYLFEEIFGIHPEELKRTAVYCGDSPNDESMFRFFPKSFGVANVLDYAHKISSMPNCIAEGRGGLGFREIVSALISSYCA